MQTKNLTTKINERSGISLLVAFALAMGLLCSCGTTRYYQVNSEPEGALILKGDKWYLPAPVESPDNLKLKFGSKTEYTFVAMKRGYIPDTLIVNRETPDKITLYPKRIENVTAELPRPPHIPEDRASLLPVDVEFVWHKGVGALDKYDVDDELSAKCSDELARLLTADGAIGRVKFPGALPSGWMAVNNPLRQYLLSLNPVFLNYYPEPALIDKAVKRDELQAITGAFNTADTKYLMYIYCKSIRPTAGRIVGNIAVSAASATMFTAGMMNYYNPSVFGRDNSTLASVYIIDPQTYEVVEIKQIITSYDIYKPEQLEKFAGEIIHLLTNK